ncbi:sterol desaturase family protein [soil metagenome]
MMTGVIFSILIVRYFLVAGLFYLYFFKWKQEAWVARKLHRKNPSMSQCRKEISWSVITSVIFAVAGTLSILLWQQGNSRIYLEIAEFGWLYFMASIVIAMLLHETYYYWLHRWMHTASIFRTVHKVHHDSMVVSPWTAFSFHPLEGLLEALVLPLLIFILPLHPYAIVIYLTIMTISSVVNHLDIELFPKNFDKHWLGKWLIGATHHSAHHSHFRFNYGLYFTFWDKWMRTEKTVEDNLVGGVD